MLFISAFIPFIIIIYWLHKSFGSDLVFTSITMLCALIAILSINNLTTKWYLEELDATINSKQYLPNLTEKTLLLLGVEGIALLVHYFQEHFVYIIAFLIIPLAFLIKRKSKRKSLPDIIGELNRKKILGT